LGHTEYFTLPWKKLSNKSAEYVILWKDVRAKPPRERGAAHLKESEAKQANTFGFQSVKNLKNDDLSGVFGE
jgi:hypothetical protein